MFIWSQSMALSQMEAGVIILGNLLKIKVRKYTHCYLAALSLRCLLQCFMNTTIKHVILSFCQKTLIC